MPVTPLILNLPAPDTPSERSEQYREVLKTLRDDGLNYQSTAALVGVHPECISKRIRGHVTVTQEAFLSALYLRDMADRELEIRDAEEEEL